MGCRDRESNFQHMFFRDGKWWTKWGLEPCWEGPTEELIKQFPGFHEPKFIQGDSVYAVERTENDMALVKPLGQVMIKNY